MREIGYAGAHHYRFCITYDLQKELASGTLSVVLTNKDVEQAAEAGHGVIGFLTSGCPIVLTGPFGKVKTIAGMEHIARKSELYFNLHTKGQTFYGDIRGQLHPLDSK